MTIAINEQQTGTATTGTTVTPTAFTTAPSASELIIVCLGGVSGTAWTGPGTGPAFTMITATADASACNEVIGWAKGDGSTTSFVFTQTGGAGTDGMCVRIMRVGGLDTTGASELATVIFNQTATTSAALTPGTSTVANELWVANCNLGSTSITPSGGAFTGSYTDQGLITAVGSTYHTGLLVGTEIVSATAATSTTASWTGSDEYEFAFVAFKAAAGATFIAPKPLVVSQAVKRASSR